MFFHIRFRIDEVNQPGIASCSWLDYVAYRDIILPHFELFITSPPLPWEARASSVCSESNNTPSPSPPSTTIIEQHHLLVHACIFLLFTLPVWYYGVLSITVGTCPALLTLLTSNARRVAFFPKIHICITYQRKVRKCGVRRETFQTLKNSSKAIKYREIQPKKSINWIISRFSQPFSRWVT